MCTARWPGRPGEGTSAPLLIRHYLAMLRRYALLIAAIVVAAVIAGWFVGPTDHTYTATSTLYVGSRSINISPASGEVSGDRVAGLDRLITTFAAMARTQPVAQATLATTGVDRS